MKAIAIIPARYASTRFPAKALALIGGKPMIRLVYEAVLSCEIFSEVIVATDSTEILNCVKSFGGKALMTSEHHLSGSDRIAETAKDLDAEIIVNVQGDEPFIDRDCLSSLLNVFKDESVRIASLMTRITDQSQLMDPNCVKVVTDISGNAIYFSRSPIPFNRDKADVIGYFRHIGVYAYRPEALFLFVSLPLGKLEQIEKLEQLRALENGIPIRMVETAYQGVGIDTPEDLVSAEQLLISQRAKS
ncbi:MAG: 3-deoxy-manno-octulosonate cytidylyltransferase [Candidatus Cloacimonadaceae bacterium]|nr:3-deoxy-manno-octulosonate cytidylyltransferase [Candidatus Cloacimonadaceae bacterium]MDP3113334.1 3-deoxy-manno-octulosonate cytidylyltransferase [Candidatus Cloacimonadaceae bacterium]